jgi:hypothetical protein
MTFHSASPACPSARRFLKQCHVPTPRIGKLSIAGCDFTHCGEAHRSSRSSSGCRRLLCDRRSLDDVVAPQGQHCLAAWASARSTVAGAWLVLTLPLAQQALSAAVSLERTAVSPSICFACLLPHTCGPASTRLCRRMHRLCAERRFNSD